MSRKLLLEKLKVYFNKQLDAKPQPELWQVSFVSDITGILRTFETESYEQAQVFRETMHLLNDPTSEPRRLWN